MITGGPELELETRLGRLGLGDGGRGTPRALTGGGSCEARLVTGGLPGGVGLVAGVGVGGGLGVSPGLSFGFGNDAPGASLVEEFVVFNEEEEVARLTGGGTNGASVLAGLAHALGLGGGGGSWL